MNLNEIFQTLKSLSKADLNSVKEYFESLEAFKYLFWFIIVINYAI